MTIHFANNPISMNSSGYGSTSTRLTLIWSDKSKRELMRYCRDASYNRLHEGDRPGQAFATSLTVLRYVKGDSDMWQAVCLSSVHYDV